MQYTFTVTVTTKEAGAKLDSWEFRKMLMDAVNMADENDPMLMGDVKSVRVEETGKPVMVEA